MSFKVHREGFPFIALFAGVYLLAFLMSPLPGLLLLPLTIWCIAFFRDPDRVTPTGAGLIFSPADGKLLPIIEAAPPPELGLGDAPRLRLSIFMNVFNVHVNRNPISGTVIALAYRPGKFLNAAADKASDENERMALAFRRSDGRVIGCVQIAGWVARRIVCYVKPGQSVVAGERFGHIRFGSRTDLYLPRGARLLVAPGQRMIGGETVMAELDPVAAGPRLAIEF